MACFFSCLLRVLGRAAVKHVQTHPVLLENAKNKGLHYVEEKGGPHAEEMATMVSTRAGDLYRAAHAGQRKKGSNTFGEGGSHASRGSRVKAPAKPQPVRINGKTYKHGH